VVNSSATRIRSKSTIAAIFGAVHSHAGRLYAAFVVLFLTSTAWLLADWQKSTSSDEMWQQTAAYLLMVHGGAAMAALLLLGTDPAARAALVAKGQNLVSGSTMVTLNALLVVTAVGLYYLGSETVRPWMSWIHIGAGLAPQFALHIILGRLRLV